MSANAPFFAHAGFGCMVCADRVVVVMDYALPASQRYYHTAKEKGFLIDVTKGKGRKSLLLLDNGAVIVSHISSLTMRRRLSNITKDNAEEDSLQRDTPEEMASTGDSKGEDIADESD